MIPAALNPMPSIQAAINGIKSTIMKVKESLFNTMKEIRSNAFKAKNIVNFLKFTPVIVLTGLIIGLLKKPLEFLVMLIGGIIISVIYAIYKLTAMKESPFTYIVFVIWWLINKALFMIVYTLVILVVVLFISMFLGVIALLNFFSGGALNNLVLCQTSPTAWYELPNYHLGNRFERSLFCKSPCFKGYYPDEATGEFCQRLPKGQPSFCPQAEAMRLYQKKAGKLERHVFSEYDPVTDYTFTLSSPNEKENRYKYHFVNKQKFLDTCSRNLGEYTKFSRDLCTNIDAIEKLKLNGLTKQEINRLKDVCNQGFCNSKSRYFFCGEFGENQEESRGNKLIKEVVLFSLYAIVFMIILYYTYQIIMSI